MSNVGIFYAHWLIIQPLQFVGSMFAQAKADEGPAQDGPLPQDLKEGVDSDEWDD